MKTVTFRKEVQEQLDLIKTADIVVGIPSFNNARTIGHVVRAVQAGLAKYFPDRKSVLVNSDGGSHNRTNFFLTKRLNGIYYGIVTRFFCKNLIFDKAGFSLDGNGTVSSFRYYIFRSQCTQRTRTSKKNQINDLFLLPARLA